MHVFSDSVSCVGHNDAIANQAWTTKFSEVWDPMTFMRKYDITGRPVQFHWLIFSGHTAIQIMRDIHISWDPRNRVVSKEESSA